jgi:hypothetical protein
MRNEAELVPSPRHHSSHPAFHKAILEPESSGRELAARPRTASLHEGWSNHPCPCGSGKKDKLLSRLDRRALVAGPTHEHLGRRQECAAVKQARKSLGRWLSAPTFEHREKAEHGGRLLHRHLVVPAVAGVPAERRGGRSPNRLERFMARTVATEASPARASRRTSPRRVSLLAQVQGRVDSGQLSQQA